MAMRRTGWLFLAGFLCAPAFAQPAKSPARGKDKDGFVTLAGRERLREKSAKK
jgi:hypothetical protein